MYTQHHVEAYMIFGGYCLVLSKATRFSLDNSAYIIAECKHRALGTLAVC